MLRRLKVENYALIDRLELELDDRLNIITGETGAGKSILLGALGLLLGNKNDNATLKDDKRNCLIEGVSISEQGTCRHSSTETTWITTAKRHSRARSPRPARAARSSTTLPFPLRCCANWDRN